MRLTGKRILVEQFKTKEITEGGIALPSTSVQALPYGIVKKVGPLVREMDVIVTEGDVVLFSEIGAIPLGHIKKGCVLVEPEDVLAILEKGEY